MQLARVMSQYSLQELDRKQRGPMLSRRSETHSTRLGRAGTLIRGICQPVVLSLTFEKPTRPLAPVVSIGQSRAVAVASPLLWQHHLLTLNPIPRP